MKMVVPVLCCATIVLSACASAPQPLPSYTPDKAAGERYREANVAWMNCAIAAAHNYASQASEASQVADAALGHCLAESDASRKASEDFALAGAQNASFDLQQNLLRDARDAHQHNWERLRVILIDQVMNSRARLSR